jgi:heme O synthase-like polyprenyltransferase
MKNNFIGEAVISLVLIALLIFFLNPMELWMPQSMHAIMIPLLVILFIVFSGALWKEASGDEREQLHIFIASRFAYFAAIAALVIGIVIQSFQKAIDPWLIVAICVALLAKIAGILYGHIKH